MLFINFISLIDGKLLNEPQITSFNNIAYKLKDIKSGDLFIGKNSEVKKAIDLGAYGVVSTNLRVTDDEIAWIEITDIHTTKLKILRYSIIKSNLPVILLSDVEYQILLKITSCSNTLLLTLEDHNVLNKLKYPQDLQFIVSTSSKDLDKLDVKAVSWEYHHSIDVIKHTLFLTTFKYNNTLYSDIRFSKLFIENLNKVLNILDYLKLDYNIQNLNFIDHFKPIFIDSNFHIKPFGKSTQALILEHDKKLLKSIINFLVKYASWANIALVKPQKLSVDLSIETYTYQSFSDINSLDISNLNFVVILDPDIKYEKYLIKRLDKIQNSLFL
jgi:hypothetical protein